MKKMKTKIMMAFIGLSVLLFGCRPSELDYISDYDLVVTNYDKDYSFSSVNTYFLPDSVVFMTDDPLQIDHQYDDEILGAVKRNLDALGWTQLPETPGNKADVVIVVGASSTDYASCASYCWYCYWGWYPGWGYYPPAWGPGYGWGYPPAVACATYSTGSVFVGITDPDKASSNTLPVAWTGILNGLLEGSDASILQRVTSNIDQMFKQSPYLKN
jgi:hypothetical protein